MGRFETKRKLSTKIRIVKVLFLRKNSCNPIFVVKKRTIVKDAINNALAGVGNPIKDVACLSSMLNLANLNAEKTGMKTDKQSNRISRNLFSTITMPNDIVNN